MYYYTPEPSSAAARWTCPSRFACRPSQAGERGSAKWVYFSLSFSSSYYYHISLSLSIYIYIYIWLFHSCAVLLHSYFNYNLISVSFWYPQNSPKALLKTNTTNNAQTANCYYYKMLLLLLLLLISQTCPLLVPGPT